MQENHDGSQYSATVRRKKMRRMQHLTGSYIETSHSINFLVFIYVIICLTCIVT